MDDNELRAVVERTKHELRVEFAAKIDERTEAFEKVVSAAAARAKRELASEQRLWKRPEFWTPLMVTIGLGAGGWFVSMQLDKAKRDSDASSAAKDARLKEMEIVSTVQDILTGQDVKKKRFAVALLQEYVDDAERAQRLLSSLAEMADLEPEVASAARAAQGLVLEKLSARNAAPAAQASARAEMSDVIKGIVVRLFAAPPSTRQAFGELRAGWRNSDIAVFEVCKSGLQANRMDGAAVWNAVQFLTFVNSEALRLALRANAPCIQFIDHAADVLTDPNDGGPSLVARARRAVSDATASDVKE